MKVKWIEGEKPREYRLCRLHLGDKIVSGWWTGFAWDGVRYDGEEVKKWRYLRRKIK